METFWRHRPIEEHDGRGKCLKLRNGEVTERLKVHDWKSCVPLIRVPRVRIPPSPPAFRFSFKHLTISSLASDRSLYRKNRRAFRPPSGAICPRVVQVLLKLASSAE